jgi:hypothetical protein
MREITISKKEYHQLLDKALRYDYFRQLIEEDIFAPPPTKNIEEILRAFKKTKIYSSEFLKSLERGLRRSSYFKK